RAPSINFERYIRREVLEKLSEPLVWGLDEVDRLFTCPYASEVFGLFRTWHNERAVDPMAPWGQLTLAIVYATEAHLFITDQNQSPFNVGTRLELKDFSIEQVGELNARYNSPLKGNEEGGRFFKVLSGRHGRRFRPGGQTQMPALRDLPQAALALNQGCAARAMNRQGVRVDQTSSSTRRRFGLINDMATIITPTSFYVIGGTLQRNAPS